MIPPPPFQTLIQFANDSRRIHFISVALVDWFCNKSLTAPLPTYLANAADKNTAFRKAPIKVIRKTPRSIMMGLLEQ